MMKPSLFLTLSLALVLSLTLNSCVKDNDLPATKTTIEKPAALAFDDGATSNRMTEWEKNACNCSYQIIEVSAEPLFGPTEGFVDYYLTSDHDCTGTIDDVCTGFECNNMSAYGSVEACQCYDSDCTDFIQDDGYATGHFYEKIVNPAFYMGY